MSAATISECACTDDDPAFCRGSLDTLPDDDGPGPCQCLCHQPVPPFPSEPAFGSPEAVEQAARSIRRYGLNTAGRIFMLDDDQPDEIAHFANLEDHRAALAELAQSRADHAETIEKWRAVVADEQAQREAHRLASISCHEMQEQRDALAEALLELRNYKPGDDRRAIARRADDALKRAGKLL